MTPTIVQTICHTAIVLALLAIYALTRDGALLTFALGWITAGGVTFAAAKATGTT